MSRILANSYRAELIAGDYRSIIFKTQGQNDKDFLGLSFIRTGEASPIFNLPLNQEIQTGISISKIDSIISFDMEGNRVAGTLQFYFNRFENIYFSLGAWLLLALVSIPFASYERRRAKREYELSIELRSNEAMVQLASQVAHDIRSPLAALETVVTRAKEIPEHERQMIRHAVNRINDIANNLLEQNRETKNAMVSDVESSHGPLQSQLLSSLIEPLISEKRMTFRSKLGVEISANLDSSNYGLFANVQAVEFKRVLSNLINNSVEAIGDSGRVVVHLAHDEKNIFVRVQDNGRGIHPELIKKLGALGETHGKVEGHGIGLHHAFETARRWGGDITIESELDKGTSVSFILPKGNAPAWFVDRLKLQPHHPIVILDDDTTIHKIWQGRFDSLMIKDHDISVHHFSTPDEIRHFASDHSHILKQTKYLADYELVGFEENGLDLIEKLDIGPQSILVTSRYEEPHIMERCERLGVRLIPKGLAGLIPISIIHSTSPDAILIDDDKLMLMVWESAAQKAKKTLMTFSSPSQFYIEAPILPKNTPIYIDANLGDGIRGEDVARQLHEMGFTTLYIASGHNPEEFDLLKGIILGCTGKRPPW